MTSINQFMTEHHRHCDELIATAENAVQENNWDLAGEETARFIQTMENHFVAEEQALFPAFEERTGIVHGPTQVMRMEHDQLRALFAQLQFALSEQDEDEFLGLSETTLILMAQHNMKEEGMLYPMIDAQLADQLPALMERVKAITG